MFYAENTPVLELLREHGCSPRSTPPTLAAVPRALQLRRRATGSASRRASSVLVYNNEQAGRRKLPTSILELAAPQWKGKVGFAPSETDFQPLVSAIDKLDGRAVAERWLEALKANGKIYPDNETVVAQVNNGESAIGPINHYYWYRLRDEVGAGGTHSALHYFAAATPATSSTCPARRCCKSSAHQTAAQRFLAFLVSAKGQQRDRAQRQLRVPAAPRRGTGAPGSRRSACVEPNSLTPAELGDGSARAGNGAAGRPAVERRR